MSAIRIVAVTLLLGCAKPGPDAHALFEARCIQCHGAAGHGDGPALAKLPVKPPDFADAGWQRTVSDDELRRSIVFGGPAVGKNPAMPAGRDLEASADVLVVLVRSFSGGGALPRTAFEHAR